MSTSRTKRIVGALAATAAGGLMTLAFASPASAATPSGDWATAQSAYTVQPGGVIQPEIDFVCLSAAGCDYDPSLLLKVTSLSDATITTTGEVEMWLTTAGTTDVGIGTCPQIQTNGAVCQALATGHAAEGAHITIRLDLDVPATTSPDTKVMYSHLDPGAGVWDGNNEANDSAYTSTAQVVDSPIADWGIAGGAAGGLALLGAGSLLARRRKAGALAA